MCLGFGMNLREVVHAGRSGFVYTAISIAFALTLGVLLGKMLQVGKTQSLLISVGTAICGGSAIAAMGPVLEANDEEMAVSLGTVFVLNSVALLLFPFIGWHLHLSQTQFGLWAALAIHDTSSVVGAGAKYGATALAVGTTVKLARALVDCAADGGDGDVEEEQGEGAVAVVHSVFLCGGGVGELCSEVSAADCGAVCWAESSGPLGSDGSAVFDRDGNLTEHTAASGHSASTSGSGTVACGGGCVALGYPCRMDRVVGDCRLQASFWGRVGTAAGRRACR